MPEPVKSAPSLEAKRLTLTSNAQEHDIDLVSHTLTQTARSSLQREIMSQMKTSGRDLAVSQPSYQSIDGETRRIVHVLDSSGRIEDSFAVLQKEKTSYSSDNRQLLAKGVGESLTRFFELEGVANDWHHYYRVRLEEGQTNIHLREDALGRYSARDLSLIDAAVAKIPPSPSTRGLRELLNTELERRGLIPDRTLSNGPDTATRPVSDDILHTSDLEIHQEVRTAGGGKFSMRLDWTPTRDTPLELLEIHARAEQLHNRLVVRSEPYHAEDVPRGQRTGFSADDARGIYRSYEVISPTGTVMTRLFVPYGKPDLETSQLVIGKLDEYLKQKERADLWMQKFQDYVRSHDGQMPTEIRARHTDKLTLEELRLMQNEILQSNNQMNIEQKRGFVALLEKEINKRSAS